METNTPNRIEEESLGLSKRADWQDAIEAHSRSQLSIRQYCMRQGLSLPAFYYWRDKLAGRKRKTQSKKTTRGQFVPVSVSPDSSTGIKITLPPGIVIESSTLVDKDWLLSLIKELIEKI